MSNKGWREGSAVKGEAHDKSYKKQVIKRELTTFKEVATAGGG